MRLPLLAVLLPLAACTGDATPAGPAAEVPADDSPVVAFAPGDGCARLGEEAACLEVADASVVVVTRGGREVARWATDAPMGPPRVAAFRLRLGDAEGLAVGVLDAVSNGLGVSYWRLYALPDGAAAPAYSLRVEELAEDGGSFAGTPERPVLWATHWTGAADPTGRRGPGTYFVGRPMALGAASVQPVPSLPVRARRLLAAFRTEPGGPAGWLASPRALDWPDEAGPVAGTSGEIRAVTSVSDSFTLDVAVGGEIRTFAIDTWTTPEGAEDAALADAATGRLLPLQYRPADLVGRTVRVADGPDGPVLWL